MPVRSSSRSIKTKVFEIAEARGIKQSWLAKQYGMTQETLSRIKRGEVRISRRFMEKSCEIFDMPLSALFFVVDVRDTDTGEVL
ncbi:MAG: XRE family transcriptional regulator [Gaiellales bacterium]|nr:MAG: XRE family transcriptional regulator [Gaiellales bacterium]